jgi:DNA-binding SARP family transcriptional activator/Flp pilus assembly protein TadD/TolB-like protein
MSALVTLGRVRLAADRADASSTTAQPKRIALLTYLVIAAGRTPVRREVLLALFWPEFGDDEGRRALRQALHYLRRVIGDDVFETSGDELRVRDGAVSCDAIEFERLIDANKPAEALELYGGDFFTGFHVDDVSSDYEEWVDRTRARLRRRASTAAWSAADAHAAAGERERAIELAERACMLEPDQESGWRRLMTLQARVGDRTAALRTYDELEKGLDREFGAKPSAESTALARQIRSSPGDAPAVVEPSVAAPAPRVVANPEPAATSEPVRPARRRRLSPLVASLLGVAAIGVAAAAYIRLSAPDDGPSLVKTGSLGKRDRLLVADFANLAGDSLLARAITEAFRVDLAQSTLIRVIPPRAVAAGLARMELPTETTVDDSLAREIAIRQGAKAFVAGSVAKVASAYKVNVQLLSTARGDVLASISETANDSTELIDAIDRASKRLRHRIGESLGELRDMPALELATTASLPALRKFTEGERETLAGRRSNAVRSYQQAIALDTAFGSAWVSLGMAYGSLAEPGRAMDALAHAVAHEDRLPFRDRQFAVASHAVGRGDFDTAIDAYTRVLEKFPDETPALNNLALIYQRGRRYADAESLFTRAAAIDSTIANFYFGIHGEQLLQGEFAASRRTLDYIARRFPENPVRLTIEIQDAAAQQRWEDAERRVETRIASVAGDTLELIDPFEALAGIMMTQGRLAEAERHWRTQLKLSKASGSFGRHLFGVIQLGYLELEYRNAPARALAFVDSSLAHLPIDSVLPGDRPYDELARFYARAGRLTRAKQMLAAAEANDKVLGRASGSERSWTLGVIALAEGRGADAEHQVRLAADGLPCEICALPDLARVYEKVGKADAAVTVYERYLSTPWFWRYEPDAVELGWAMKRLAELYDARGEPEKATATRNKLVQLWRRADPELGPVFAEVRSRLTTPERRR